MITSHTRRRHSRAAAHELVFLLVPNSMYGTIDVLGGCATPHPPDFADTLCLCILHFVCGCVSAVAVAKDWAYRESVEGITLAVEGLAAFIHNFGEPCRARAKREVKDAYSCFL